jgi:3-deoxy-manno-octulosonate cytidylyltransferase (CMP-KDO synthetase)
MNIVAMIPARMGSTRFPGKPLAPILGRSMLEHVYKRTALAKCLSDVYVATCDEEIFSAVEAFGGRAIMTSDRHERASDRIAEAAAGIEADVIVMVQGDEPMVHPEMIEAAVAPMQRNADINCVNLKLRIDDEDDFKNRNTIKVVTDAQGRALYLSRQPIPDATGQSFARIDAFKQVCIMPFRRDALLSFAELAPTALEIAESIDMLRFLEHGHPVHMVETMLPTQAVDTPDDLAKVEKLMRDDPLVSTY